MRHNTTDHLIEDIERLRTHLGVDRWVLFGGSWGSTLILAYAQCYPDRVSGIVISPVTTTSPAEIDWLYRGVGRFLPEAWERFRAGVPDAGPETVETKPVEIVAAYASLMEDPDPAVRREAADRWCAWEDAVISHEGASAGGSDGGADATGREGRGGESRAGSRDEAGGEDEVGSESGASGEDEAGDESEEGHESEAGRETTIYGGRPPAAKHAFVRIATHYFANGAWLEENQLLRNADRLAGIPGVLVHGRLDLAAPLDTAWKLDRAWPDADLVVVDDAGHLGSGGMTAHRLDALDSFVR